MNFKIKEKITPFVFSLIILSLFLFLMWDFSIQYSKDSMSRTVVFLDATNWLSDNLFEEEIAILPVSHMFLANNPALKQHSKSYLSFWKESKIDIIHATPDEKFLVRQMFWDYISTDANKIKYLVLSSNDLYMREIVAIHQSELNNLGVCTEINLNLKEVIRFNINIPSSGWKSSLVICEVKLPQI